MSPQWQILVHAAAGRPAILPRPIRMDWLYVRDAAAGIGAVLGATGMRQRVVDLGGGAAFDVLQWADAIGKHHPNVVCRLAGPGETPNVGYFLARDRAPLTPPPSRARPASARATICSRPPPTTRNG